MKWNYNTCLKKYCDVFDFALKSTQDVKSKKAAIEKLGRV